jgi:GntR family transcriptional regulator of vanillate catabolism
MSRARKSNVGLNNTWPAAHAPPWLARFAEQADNVPYAADCIVLWDVDHARILRSHGNYRRIVDAVMACD